MFLHARFWKVKGPGLVIVLPGVMQMVRVDLRLVTMDVPSQDVISRDNVSVKVNAVLFFHVVDPQRAIPQVENFLVATRELAQTTPRVVLGKHDFDEILAERERRAKIIHAEGEKQASATLLEAARRLAQ